MGSVASGRAHILTKGWSARRALSLRHSTCRHRLAKVRIIIILSVNFRARIPISTTQALFATVESYPYQDTGEGRDGTHRRSTAIQGGIHPGARLLGVV